METIETKDARAGVTSRRHKVARVLIISLVLVGLAWLALEFFFN